MRPVIALALLEDAWRQVTDNLGFRLLIGLALVPVLLTLLVGFHEDHLEALGIWSSDYSWLVTAPGHPAGASFDLQAAAVEKLRVITLYFGLVVGVVVCLAATASFVPRMLEKGAADVLFSKPVSRLSLLLSRYLAGILFTSCLALVVVFGMFLGLRLRSGVSAPLILWDALTWIYVFAALFAFTLFMAVATRSGVAAILFSITLYALGTISHWHWGNVETDIATLAAARTQIAEAKGETPPTAEEVRASFEEHMQSVPRLLWKSARTLHYVLPKTNEAPVLVRHLRLAADASARDTSAPPDKYGWGAPLRYNLWFSLGSTVLFIAAMLALAWAKLRTIDF